MTPTPDLLPLRQASSWSAKPCDVCGEGTVLREAGHRRYELTTRRHRVEMLMQDVICGTCGFLFAAKVPEAEFLTEFYKDAHTPRSDVREIKPDFDADARLATLRAHLKPGATILEIGANDGTFTEALRREGYEAIGLDPLESAQDEYVVNAFTADGASNPTDPGALEKCYDAVPAYYVLEHVPDARAWLAEVRGFLKPGGVLIIEVPDFATHPVESLYPEHFLHFTPTHLRRLLESAGFEVVECGTARSSRYFGFTTVARRREMESPVGMQPMPMIEESRQRYAEALDSITREEQRMDQLAAHLLDAHVLNNSPVRVFVWAANIHATRLARSLAALQPSIKPVIVDSAISKIGTLHEGFEAPVQAPPTTKPAAGRDVFVLCSPNWNDDIRQQIHQLGYAHATVIDGIRWTTSD